MHSLVCSSFRDRFGAGAEAPSRILLGASSKRRTLEFHSDVNSDEFFQRDEVEEEHVTDVARPGIDTLTTHI